MNWKPTGVGADPKKIGILVALLAVAGYFYFSNRDSGAPASTPRASAAVSSPVAPD